MTANYLTGLTVETRFLSPTDHRGSRISAVCKRDSDHAYRCIVNWDHSINPEDNHAAAVAKLIDIIDSNDEWAQTEHFRIVARGYGGSNESAYYWLINRGGC